jgi:hypothetical protein
VSIDNAAEMLSMIMEMTWSQFSCMSQSSRTPSENWMTVIHSLSSEFL